jgi:hypothetical protein
LEWENLSLSIQPYYMNLCGGYIFKITFLSLQYWDMNLGPHGCEADALPLKPHLQPQIFIMYYYVYNNVKKIW